MTASLSPPTTRTEDGTPRRVGVELEIGGVDVRPAADLVASCLGGVVRAETDYEVFVDAPALGELRVEVDSRVVKKLGRERGARAAGVVERAVAAAAKTVLPIEIVTPPLAFDALPRLDELVVALRGAGARGTDQSAVHAFGAHFNPDAPSLRADSILAHVRAFALLHDWLLWARDVDLSRRLTPFIDPYPGEYVALVVDPAYAPDRERLIDDYLLYNPTRNRALDMLCLFAHLEEDRVRAEVDDERIAARPTYHYRLANSDVDNPSWRITDEWRCWLVVERLAADAPLLESLSGDYLAAGVAGRPAGPDDVDPWVAHVAGRVAGLCRACGID